MVGKTGIYKGRDACATFASYLIPLRFPEILINSDYINIIMNSPFYRKPQIEPEIVQQCGQANFNGSKLAKTVLPIPPLSEQNQIVVKVKEIMKLVDQLEMKENEAIISGENLLESLAEKLI